MVAWLICGSLAGTVAGLACTWPVWSAQARTGGGGGGDPDAAAAAAAKLASDVATALYNPVVLLAVEAAQVAGGLAAIYLVAVRRYRAELPGLQLFRCSPKGPFRKPSGWLAWALLSGALALAVVFSMSALVQACGYNRAFGGGYRTAQALVGLRADAGSFLCLGLVAGVLAPLMEEVVFRGFLLVALTKWMPAWAAVLCSSAAFAAVHGSLRDLPVLLAFACVLGFSYVRSKNLLTPMLVHGAWNLLMLSTLYYYVISGGDLQQVMGSR
jgi:hypothetical protein